MPSVKSTSCHLAVGGFSSAPVAFNDGLIIEFKFI